MNLHGWLELQARSATGIRWGTHQFSVPTTLLFKASDISMNQLYDRLREPGVHGLYAIMIKNPLSVQQFDALYFGQSKDIYYRPSKNHENFSDWCDEANGKPLYVSYFEMRGSTEQKRKEAEDALIRMYKPPCNLIGSVAQSIRVSV